MAIQMRTYTINRGAMKQWVKEWHQQIKPLRVKIGFDILGAWTIDETNQFVWLMAYNGQERWEDLDQAFHQSEERHAMNPDPARHIARMEHYFLEPV